jgi:uncharacterized protein (DUF1501 family)
VKPLVLNPWGVLLLAPDREPVVLRFFTDSVSPLTRREWLRLGAAGGLGLAGLPRVQAGGAAGVGKARSVLIVFASGGQSQIDTWDPKPDAPAEVRGAFRSVATSVPGTRLCEHMPRLARLAHRCTIVRSMAHDDLDHGSACYLSLTGRFHPQKSSNPPPRPTDYPTLGAVVQRLRPAAQAPAGAATLNGPLLVPEVVSPGQFAGLLGRAHEPLLVGDVRAGAAALGGLEARDDLPPVRAGRRRSLLRALEHCQRTLEHDRAAMDLLASRAQAYRLLDGPATRNAFDLSREPAALRERYGLHRAGQACLLARRLVEAGVPLVTVFFNPSVRGQDKDPTRTDAYGWDTHNDIFAALADHLLPRFDRTVSTLLEDLRQRGLLETTLVLCMGEFGRAPRVALERTFAGSSPGRKHHAAVYSILAAGAGVCAGKVLGASDRQGAYPTTPAYSPADLAATLFAALGMDPEGHYRDALDRPYQVSEGKLIRGLYQG